MLKYIQNESHADRSTTLSVRKLSKLVRGLCHF